MLKNIAQMVNPTLYQTKSDELAIEKSTWNAVLPVFFYNVVMFPGEILSLHLFEPRYKVLIFEVITDPSSSSLWCNAFLQLLENLPISMCPLIDHCRRILLSSPIFGKQSFSQVHIVTDSWLILCVDGRCLVEAVISFPRYSIQEIYGRNHSHALVTLS